MRECFYEGLDRSGRRTAQLQGSNGKTSSIFKPYRGFSTTAGRPLCFAYCTCSLGASTGGQTLNSGELSNSEARNKQPTSATGRLKYSKPFWQTVLNADKHILQVLEEGYRIPFVSRPPTFNAKNNRSALQESGFVKDDNWIYQKRGMQNNSSACLITATP